MKEKVLDKVNITYHYAHTNKYRVNKLIDTSDSDQGIIRFLDSESDTQSIKVKFLPDYAKSFNLSNKNIQVDTYCGIVSHIPDIKSQGYTLGNSYPGGNGRGPLVPTPTDNVMTYDSNKGYCFQYPIIDRDPRSTLPIFVGYSDYPYHCTQYTDAPPISPDFFGYIQGDFQGNLTNTLSPLCTIFQKKLAYVEDYQHGKLKIYTSTYDKTGYTMQLSPVLINEIIDNVQFIGEQKENISLKEEFLSSPLLQDKQESIKKELLQLNKDMIQLNEKYLIDVNAFQDNINGLTALSNKSIQITNDFQEFTNILGLETNIDLLGTNTNVDIQ